MPISSQALRAGLTGRGSGHRDGTRGGIILILAWIAFQPPAVLAVQGSPTADERRLLELINAERRERHLNRLSWEPTLARLARAHASDMKSAGRITHFSSRDGAEFATRLGRMRLRVRAAAENVAYDRDIWRAHRGLMASPGHRRNILDPELTAIGIALSDDGRSLYVVEDFAAPIAGAQRRADEPSGEDRPMECLVGSHLRPGVFSRTAVITACAA